MLNEEIPALDFPIWPLGTHQVGWNLQLLLYPGAASMNRRLSVGKLRCGDLGAPRLERLPVLANIHGQVEARLVRGDSFRTLQSNLDALTTFVTWTDGEGQDLTVETARALFLKWTDHLLWRVEVEKKISQESAHGVAARVAGFLARVLEYPSTHPGGLLMKHSRLRAPIRAGQSGKNSLDKKRLERVFQFGQMITDLCRGLTAEVIRGRRPIDIPLRTGGNMRLDGRVSRDVDTLYVYRRKNGAELRAPLPPDACLITARPYFLNARIESELLLFISQTGMNLSQAVTLRREEYRWRSDGDELNAFRVFKGRRRGEAIFRCFKAYRQHLRRYLTWLDEVGLSAQDERIFPFIYYGGVIPYEQYYPSFTSTKNRCSKMGIEFFGPRALRRTRINWLLRETADVVAIASIAAHSSATLVRVYRETNRSSAATEILRFHKKTDPTLAPPGPGLCAGNGKHTLDVDVPQNAPQPDCISPDGCLFCVHHRDVRSADYCFQLASHSKLKKLEAALAVPTKGKSGPLPAHIVVDRLEAKLDAIASENEARALWVRRARSAVKAGDFHPAWEAQIQLMEVLSDFA